MPESSTHRAGQRGWRRTTHGSPARAFILLLSLLVSALILAPLGAIALRAYGDGAGAGALLTVLSSGKIIGNTVLVGAGATGIAVATGGSLALALVRFATPGRAALGRLATLPLYVTPLLTAIAWSWLGSPRGGLINLAARQWLGIDALINLHTPGGIVFVAGLAYAPLPFLLIGAALRGMDPALEESARVHGASPRQTLSLVTVPLVLPAISASALLVLVQAMGLFSVPAVLGMPSGFYVAGTEIYRLLNNYPPRIGVAACWGLLLLATTATLVGVQSALLARRSFVTVTGKAFRPRLLDPGAARYLLAAFAWAYVATAVILPVATLIWAGLVNFITIDPKLMTFDLRHFRYVLVDYPKTFLALKNSILLGAATACCVATLGLGIGWVVTRSRSPLRFYLDQVSMIPLAIPSMVMALGVLWLYVNLRALPIYGTLGILLVAYVAHFLPFGVRAASAALRQLHPELEDAARTAGATFAQSLRRIVWPLTRPTLLATAGLLFVLAMQEVSASILLYTSRSTVLSVATFDLWEAGNVNALAALAVLQLAITFLILLVSLRGRHQELAA